MCLAKRFRAGVWVARPLHQILAWALSPRSHSHFLHYFIINVTPQYRDGFTVDDGPYRRLDDPANAVFLRALAQGRTPSELVEDVDGSGGNIIVGLVDKRNEEYVETFRSFSGAGASLGSTANTSTDGVFDPNELTEPSPPPQPDTPTTSVAVTLLNGKRKVVKIAFTATVNDLASHLIAEADGTPFRLAAGFPPQPLTDPSATIEAAGLQGAKVSMQRA
jgi:UBX domain-containing protein 1